MMLKICCHRPLDIPTMMTWSPAATMACSQGLPLVSFSAQLEHLRVYKRDGLSGYGYKNA